MPLPLEGIRVLAQGIVWAGPYVTLILGDLGAEAIEVESISHLNPTRTGMRHIPPQVMAGATGANYVNRDGSGRFWDRQTYFNYGKRNCLSVAVCVDKPKGRELFLRLVEKSDVFLENNAAGVVEKLRVDYEDLKAVNPRLIMVRFPGYGLSGPYKYYKGYGHNVEVVAGHTWVRGYLNEPPTETSAIYHADPTAGCHVVFAIIAALSHRERTGEGQLVEMSQQEGVINHFGHFFMDYSMNRRVQDGWGNRDPSRAPHDVYPCQGEDYWVAVAIENEEQFARLCQLIGQPQLAQDPRFADVVSRYKNQDELRPFISEWTRPRTHYQAMQELQAAGVPAGAVLKQLEMREDPHLQARGYFETVTHPEAGTHSYPGPLAKLSGTPLSIRFPAPMLGQHNEYVFKEVVGLSDQEYQEFWDQQIIGDTYLETATT